MPRPLVSRDVGLQGSAIGAARSAALLMCKYDASGYASLYARTPVNFISKRISHSSKSTQVFLHNTRSSRYGELKV